MEPLAQSARGTLGRKDFLFLATESLRPAYNICNHMNIKGTPMTRFLTTTTAAIILATQAFAADGIPGGHFIENWDIDGDGKVTLAEATERRSDIFLSFDADDNGILDAEEHDLFDEARANDMKENGQGMGKQKSNPANGMLRKFTDSNGDGQVTRAEFMDSVPAWYARMDKNNDGNVTTDDFGKGH